MTNMKALVADGSGSAEVREVENQDVRDTYVKIKVHAVALNPTDYKHVFHYTKGGEIVGCDPCGEVVAIGKDVKSKVKVGDRIAGLVHGCNSYAPLDGGFAEYAQIKDGIFAHLPADWDYTHGATLGGGVTTAAQGLFQSMKLPMPDAPAKTPIEILIYGGSTATGCLAIQYANLAGLKVITLASPNQFDRLKRLGADVCYDYHTPNVGSKIRADTNDKLLYAFDIISSDDTMKICGDALASKPVDGVKPMVTLLLPGKTFPRSDVTVGLTSGYSIFGERSIKYGHIAEAVPEDYEYGLHIWSMTEKLMFEGKFHPHDIEVRPGGLNKVIEGLHDLENHRVKGVKLVYTV